MFLLVPAYPGCPGSKAVKRSLLLLLLLALLSAVALGTAGILKLEYLVFVEQVFINSVPLGIHLTGYDQL